MLTDVAVDGLLNGRVGDLMDESMKCIGAWLKMMEQVIAGVKRNELVEKVSNTEFCIYRHRS
jgi:hypothetical protein